MEHHHGILLHLRDFPYQHVLVFGHSHMLPVAALRLKALRQPGEDNCHVRIPCGLHRLFQQSILCRSAESVLRLLAGSIFHLTAGTLLHLSAGGIIPSCIGHLHSLCAVQRRHGMLFIDMAAARPLVPGLFREASDKRHPAALLQGQDAVVFQEHGALCRKFLRFPPRRLPVKDRILLLVLQSLPDEAELIPHRLIQLLPGERPLLQGLQDCLRLPLPAAGHFQIHPCLDPQRTPLGSAPVRHHKPVESPVPAQNAVQQFLILRTKCAVDGIVGAHHAPDMPLLHRVLKGGKIDFMQCPLLHPGAAGHSPGLLVVGGEMLHAGRYALALEPPDIGSRQLPRQVWILAEILEISAAQRAPLYVHPRPQKHGHMLRLALLSQELSQLL